MLFTAAAQPCAHQPSHPCNPVQVRRQLPAEAQGEVPLRLMEVYQWKIWQARRAAVAAVGAAAALCSLCIHARPPAQVAVKWGLSVIKQLAPCVLLWWTTEAAAALPQPAESAAPEAPTCHPAHPPAL